MDKELEKHPCLCDKCLQARDSELARAKEQQLTDIHTLMMYAIDDQATLQRVGEVFKIMRNK